MIKPIAQQVQEDLNPRYQLLDTASKPIHRYLDYLNAILSLLILLNSVAFKDDSGVHDGFWLLCALPARKLIHQHHV
jgi:hypothetical protein